MTEALQISIDEDFESTVVAPDSPRRALSLVPTVLEHTVEKPEAQTLSDSDADVFEEVTQKDLDEDAPPTDSIRWYLNKIARAGNVDENGRAKTLEAEEEAELSRQIEAGLIAGRVLELRRDPSPGNIERITLSQTWSRVGTRSPEKVWGVSRERAQQDVAELLRIAQRPDIIDDDLELLAQEGREARELMVASNYRLVIPQTKRYRGSAVPELDLIQEGNLGVMRAVEKFDFKRDRKFSTYAVPWIQQFMQRAVPSQGRNIAIPINIFDLMRRMNRISGVLSAELGREPTDKELAAEMELSAQEVRELQVAMRETTSLNTPVGDGDSTLEAYLADKRPTDAAGAEGQIAMLNELGAALQVLIADRTITVQDREIFLKIHGLWGDGRTHIIRNISQQTGLSEHRIQTISKLCKAKIAEVAPELRRFIQ